MCGKNISGSGGHLCRVSICNIVRHSGSRGNQASGGGGVGRGAKANDNGQRHLSDREVGVAGFDALMRSRGKNKTHNYTVFNSLGAIFRFLTYTHFTYFSN